MSANIEEYIMLSANNTSLTENQILEIAVASPAELQEFSLPRRFSTVARLQSEVLKLHRNSANCTSFYVDEEADRIDIRVEALIALSKSVRHTAAYLELLEKSRKNKIERLGNDRQLLKNTRQWQENDGNNDWNTKGSKRCLKKVQRHHVNAVNSVIREFSSINGIQTTKISLIDEPGRWRILKNGERVKRISGGYFSGDINSNKLETRLTKINKNLENRWQNDPIRHYRIMHHETVHDHGFQLAEKLQVVGKDRLTDLQKDAELWLQLTLQKAIISVKINSAYMAQFHEIVAYEQQDLFEKELLEVMKTDNAMTALSLPRQTLRRV